MIRLLPKPPSAIHYPAGLQKRPMRVTLIGAFKDLTTAVLLADRQETITDYAKWEQAKTYIWECSDQYRVAMAGAGDPDPINQVWHELCGSTSHRISGFNIAWPSYVDIKQRIIDVVRIVTKRTIFSVPRDDRPAMELIWVVQPLGLNRTPSNSLDLFRTLKLSVNPIHTHYFTGNPVLLMKYLSQTYLDNLLLTAPEMQAMAAYMLWEAKEYDPTVGKHSDIITFDFPTGKCSRMEDKESEYWEEHFRLLKARLRIVPILSCSGAIAKKVHDRKSYLLLLNRTVEFLASEQEKSRATGAWERSALEAKLGRGLQPIIKKYIANLQSGSRRSKPKQ